MILILDRPNEPRLCRSGWKDSVRIPTYLVRRIFEIPHAAKMRQLRKHSIQMNKYTLVSFRSSAQLRETRAHCCAKMSSLEGAATSLEVARFRSGCSSRPRFSLMFTKSNSRSSAMFSSNYRPSRTANDAQCARTRRIPEACRRFVGGGHRPASANYCCLMDQKPLFSKTWSAGPFTKVTGPAVPQPPQFRSP
jgi:hypothetical protein